MQELWEPTGDARTGLLAIGKNGNYPKKGGGEHGFRSHPSSTLVLLNPSENSLYSICFIPWDFVVFNQHWYHYWYNGIDYFISLGAQRTLSVDCGRLVSSFLVRQMFPDLLG